MIRLHVFAKLVDENDKPIPSRTVSLQFFELARANWRTLANLRTNSAGNVAHLRNFSSPSMSPMLRLIEGGAPAIRVLALGGIVRYDTASRTLFVDFGTVERLDDQAFALTSGISQLARQKHTIAGAPNRPNFSNALAMRMVTASQPAMTVTATSSAAARPAPTAAESAQVKALNTQVATFTVREATLNRQIQLKEDAIRQKNTQIQTLETRAAEEKRLRTAAEARESALQAQLGKQVTVDALTSNFGAQVKSAQDQMRASATPYRMGKVEIQLKALVGDQGRALTLPDAGDLSKPGAGGALADVRVELLPDEPARGDGLAGAVPDVGQLTESAARRVLQAAGFRMEVAYTSVGAAAGVVGQAVKQSPARGASHEKGKPVLVVFARE